MKSFERSVGQVPARKQHLGRFAAALSVGMLCGIAEAQAPSPAAGSPAAGNPAAGSASAAGDQAESALPAMRTLLGKLDKHFSSGNITGYLEEFDADHSGSLAMLGRHLDRLLRLGGGELDGSKPSRTSTIIAGPRTIRDRQVVRVRHQMEWTAIQPAGGGGSAGGSGAGGSGAGGSGAGGSGAGGSDAAGKQTRSLTEDTYIAFRVEDDRIVPTLCVDMPPKVSCVTEDKFRCPPCNYEIGGVEGFLCVPLRREQALALESASFHLIGTDLVCEIHVQLDPSAPADRASARSVAQTLATAFAKVEPSAKVGVPSNWLPPMHKTAPPMSLDAARIEVALPEDQPELGGRVTIFHVVTFGGLQHVLLTRSSKKTLASHQSKVDELFRSYMLLELDCGEAELAARPLRHHTGGMLDGSTYRNARYDVQIDGPDGWQPEHRVGGAMFRVRWRGPNGSQMWLIGHRVPAGMDSWTTATADRWLNHQCNRQSLQPDEQFAATSAGRWHPSEGGASCRTSLLKQVRPTQPSAPRRRIVHVQVHEDLLLVVDGAGNTEADEAAIRSAITTLQRK